MSNDTTETMVKFFRKKPRHLLRYIESVMQMPSQGSLSKSVMACHIFQLAKMVGVTPEMPPTYSRYVPYGFISPYRVKNIDTILEKGKVMFGR